MSCPAGTPIFNRSSGELRGVKILQSSPPNESLSGDGLNVIEPTCSGWKASLIFHTIRMFFFSFRWLGKLVRQISETPLWVWQLWRSILDWYQSGVVILDIYSTYTDSGIVFSLSGSMPSCTGRSKSFRMAQLLHKFAQQRGKEKGRMEGKSLGGKKSKQKEEKEEEEAGRRGRREELVLRLPCLVLALRLERSHQWRSSGEISKESEEV